MRGRKVDRARTEMIRAFLSRLIGRGRVKVSVRYDGDVFAIGRQRLKAVAELEISAILLRRPVMLHRSLSRAAGRPMDHLYATESGSGDCRGFAQPGPR